METLRDLKFSLRMFRKTPVASLVVILTLGFGIGANGIFFASFYGSAIRPLPFSDPDRLVAIHQTQPQIDETLRGVSMPDYDEWKEKTSVFSAIGAHTWEDYGFQTDDGTYRIEGASVSASLFPLLGIEPQLGRHFLEEESRPGGANVALISHKVWLDHFSGDRQVLGETVKLSGTSHEIVGVMPEGFRFSHYGMLWTPLQIDPSREPRDARRLGVIARLQPGVEVSEAQAAMHIASDRLSERFPGTHDGWALDVRTLRQAWVPVGPAQQQALIAQLALFAGVLLIVCANVTHIMLAQVTARRREMAVRSALGAGRGRLIRSSLTESLLLTAAGGVVGVGIATFSAQWLRSLVLIPLPYWLDFSLERHGLLYMLVITLGAGLATGLLPAILSTRRDRLTARLSSLRSSGGDVAADSLPITEYVGASAVAIDAQGQSFPEGEEPRVIFQWVSDEYFETLQIPRQAGRGFTPGEVSEGADVALVSESLADALWPKGDPIGHQIRPLDAMAAGDWLDVVGVVGDIEPAEMVPGFGSLTQHRIYLPLSGSPSWAAHGAPDTPFFIVAAVGDVQQQVRRALTELDPTIPPFDFRSMERVIQRFFFVQHLWSRVFAAMALFVLLLAAVGVYGVMSLSVSRREHELGVRSALGADPGLLFRQVMREGVGLAAIGIALGLLGALPLARLIGSLLFDTQGLDPSVFASVIGGLVVLGLLASASPARRAAGSDPIVALREQ